MGKHAGKWNGGTGRAGGKHELVRVGAPQWRDIGDGQVPHQERTPEAAGDNRDEAGDAVRSET